MMTVLLCFAGFILRVSHAILCIYGVFHRMQIKLAIALLCLHIVAVAFLWQGTC